ncbi:MAG TPA: hypothetical protein GXZ82_11750 [Firmicutes bacterium]|jgi:hypothetical protein|nr:hypothetical protein [Bacillota bacterium]
MKSTFWAKIAVIAVIALLPGAYGCLAAESYSTYVNDTPRYQFDYPGNWVLFQDVNIDVGFAKPLTDLHDISLVLLTVTTCPIEFTLDQYHNAAVYQAKTLLTDTKILSNQMVELGGYPAQQLILSHRLDDVAMKLQSIYAVLDGYLYLVVYQAASEAFEQHQALIDHMLSTFSLSIGNPAAPFEPLRPYLGHIGYRGIAMNEVYRIAERLGDDFTSELLDFIGDDIRLHYYIGTGLADMDDDRNTPAYRLLGLLLLEQGLMLSEQNAEPYDRYMQVSFNVVAARTAKRMGFDVLAKKYKEQALALTEADPDLIGGWPAGNPEDIAAFDAI